MTEVKVGCCVRATCDIEHPGILTVKKDTPGIIITTLGGIVIGWLIDNHLPLGPHTLEVNTPIARKFEPISDPPEILTTYPIPSAT